VTCLKAGGPLGLRSMISLLDRLWYASIGSLLAMNWKFSLVRPIEYWTELFLFELLLRLIWLALFGLLGRDGLEKSIKLMKPPSREEGQLMVYPEMLCRVCGRTGLGGGGREALNDDAGWVLLKEL
jgi:hypothetical protein